MHTLIMTLLFLFLFFLLQVDLNHIYGDNLDRQNKLRLFKDGKLRHQVGRHEDGRLLWSSNASVQTNNGVSRHRC